MSLRGHKVETTVMDNVEKERFLAQLYRSAKRTPVLPDQVFGNTVMGIVPVHWQEAFLHIGYYCTAKMNDLGDITSTISNRVPE